MDRDETATTDSAASSETSPETSPETSSETPSGGGRRTVVEEFEVSGAQLVARVKELFDDASAKRVVIRSADGDELMTIPLTIGVVAGGVLTLAAPLLAAIGALAALVTRVRLEVVREPDVEADARAGAAPSAADATDDSAGGG